MKRALHLVPAEPAPTPAQLLADVVPQLLEAEETVRQLRIIMIEEGRALARERGVGFLREEHLRGEFGR